MRLIALLPLLILAACARPTMEITGPFDTLSLDVIQNPACVFYQADAQGDSNAVLFATYRDNPDDFAVARYKSETLKLVPNEIPDFTADQLDMTYQVFDYLQWELTLQAERQVDGLFHGTMQLVDTDVTSDFVGGCDL